MKILYSLPIHNQQDRIQPLFFHLKKDLLTHESLCLIINEASTDRSSQVLSLEEKSLKTPYCRIDSKNKSRKNSFLLTLDYAQKNGFPYIVFINEGWEDNIEEIKNMILSREYLSYTLIISTRTPQRRNLGCFYNSLINTLTSIITKTPIPENKADSINIFQTKALEEVSLKFTSPQTFMLETIIQMISHQNKKVFFTDVENGLNFPSYIKLNTKRFLLSLWTLSKYTFKFRIKS
ncbi:MAG: hypothetical protein QF441_15795 [Bacteriovoracaceae bacterium]|jgi:hypothetical protein|nr:hypothetical protein [Halobacteriovoraceae bacterium]MDP7322067.1 hypothetical protein [Bacteriovoracaceae bacterium]